MNTSPIYMVWAGPIYALDCVGWHHELDHANNLADALAADDDNIDTAKRMVCKDGTVLYMGGGYRVVVEASNPGRIS
jgi:hypothetical protein